MRHFTTFLSFALFVSWTPCHHSFTVFTVAQQSSSLNSRQQQQQQQQSAATAGSADGDSSCSSSDADPSSSSSGEGKEENKNKVERPKDLVDQKKFVAAYEFLNSELAKQGAIPAPPPVDEKEEYQYGIGKLRLKVKIAPDPGFDLAESTGGMVLVSSVGGNAAEAGIQIGDTIVGVYADGEFRGSTKEANLDDSIAIFQPAMVHAVENGILELELVLNRLIKLTYQ